MAKKNRNRPKRSRKKTPEPAPVPQQSWWDQLTPVVRHSICLVALAAVPMAYYASITFGGQEVVGHDIVEWRGMAESMLEHREETGEEPLWAVNPFGGMPGYMVNYGAMVPGVDTVIRQLNRIAWPTFTIVVLLFGTYLLVYQLSRNHLAGVLAAVAYGLAPYLPIILGAGHNTKISALAYAPWLLLAFVYVLRKPGLLAGALGAIALAVNVRANHPQITYYTLILALIWLIAEGVKAARAGTFKTYGQSIATLLGGVGLSLLMVAQPYLSKFEYKAFTIRGASSSGGAGVSEWDYAMAWSQGFGELGTLFIANLFGGGGGTYWGPKTFTAGPYYLGGIVIALAVYALWRHRTAAAAGLGIGTGVMLLFSLGENFEALNRFMFNYFPLFDAFRAPEMWISVAELGIAVLAGLGSYALFAKASDGAGEDREVRTKNGMIVFGALAGIALLFVVAGSSMLALEKPGEVQQIAQAVSQQQNVDASDPRVIQFAEQYVREQKAERESLMTLDATRTLIFLVLGIGLIFAYRKTWLPAWSVQLALVLLVVIDLWGVGNRYFNEDAVGPRAAEERIPEYAYDEFIKGKVDEAGGAGHFRTLVFEGRSPTENARPAFHYETLSGYHGAKLRLYQDFLENMLYDPSGLPNENALDLSGTRYIVLPQPLPGTTVAFQDDQNRQLVLERDNARPRSVLIGNVTQLEPGEPTYAAVRSPSFDPARDAILNESVETTFTAVDSTSVARVELAEYGPREMVWTVETDATRLLVTSEVYYPPGWTATVDGTETDILRVNHLFRGVVVPAGAEQVVMRFDPQSHSRGLWISWIASLLAYGFVFGGRQLLARRAKTANEPENVA